MPVLLTSIGFTNFFRYLIIEFFLFTNADVDSNKDTDLDNNIGPICRKFIFWSWHWTDNHKIGTHRFCCKEYLFNFPISKIVNLYLLQKWWNCNKLVMPIELRTVRPSLAIVQLKKANIFLQKKITKKLYSKRFIERDEWISSNWLEFYNISCPIFKKFVKSRWMIRLFCWNTHFKLYCNSTSFEKKIAK